MTIAETSSARAKRRGEISRGLGFSGSRGEGEGTYLRRTWLEIQQGRAWRAGAAGAETLARRRRRSSDGAPWTAAVVTRDQGGGNDAVGRRRWREGR